MRTGEPYPKIRNLGFRAHLLSDGRQRAILGTSPLGLCLGMGRALVPSDAPLGAFSGKWPFWAPSWSDLWSELPFFGSFFRFSGFRLVGRLVVGLWNKIDPQRFRPNNRAPLSRPNSPWDLWPLGRRRGYLDRFDLERWRIRVFDRSTFFFRKVGRYLFLTIRFQRYLPGVGKLCLQLIGHFPVNPVPDLNEETEVSLLESLHGCIQRDPHKRLTASPTRMTRILLGQDLPKYLRQANGLSDFGVFLTCERHASTITRS